MVDLPKKPETSTGISPETLAEPLPDTSFPGLDKDNLISQIDELENLLAAKKAEAEVEAEAKAQAKAKTIAEESTLPQLNVGTDGIPVLVEPVAEEGFSSEKKQTLGPRLEVDNRSENKDEQIINDIIDKIDKEITEDLDELILMLKDSIIDEVKTRLLKELKIVKPDFYKNLKDK
ncbi:MAG TPA: hypothetical protein EYQ42_02580 [Thiotrichaceae bacterium]|jgi:hypothetical protein|nr:hypothetical protein [Thiotrichaceae bacterium]